MRSDTQQEPDQQAGQQTGVQTDMRVEATQQLLEVHPTAGNTIVHPTVGPTEIPPLPDYTGTTAAPDATAADPPSEAAAATAEYPAHDPDQAAHAVEEPERSRSKTFGEAMADAHEVLMRMTGSGPGGLSAAWDELTDGFSRTVSIVLPRPDEGSDGRCWSGGVWRVVIDAENRIAAAWDGYSDPEGFAAALFAANRKRLELIAAAKRAAQSVPIRLG